MQKALLSAAIALILVLVTALVGPHFVDWGRYRNTFETAVSRLTGLDMRIGGPIDVRLLPTPTLKLQQIALGRPDGPAGLRADALRIELALGALMRGQFLASDVGLEAPEISLAFGSSERLEWSAPLFAFDPEAVSIAHLAIEKGRVTLADGSGRSLLLDRLGFSGEVRSLLGHAKGEGSVAIDGQLHLFSIAADRGAADGAVKVRLLVDTVDHVRIGDVDSSIWIERGSPQFAGVLQWSQAAGRSPQGFNEQWRINARMHGNWSAAALDGINLQYGSDDRAVQLQGRANLTFRAQPELDVTLAATRIDLDRMLALPAAVQRRPLVAVRTMADNFGAARLPPIHVNLGISAEVVNLADAPLQRVSASLRGEGGAWDLDSLELVAPGGTQLRMRGRLDRIGRGATFAGQGRIEARDSRTLVSWLTAGSDGQAFAGPFRAEGDMRLGGESIVFDRFKAEFDHNTLEGNFSYFGAAPDHSARISATLSASSIDLNRAYALVQHISGDTTLAWPHEGSLSLNIGRASIAGVEATGADVRLQFDERALTVERLAIDDFGGARVAAAGSFDIRTLAPRGAITLDLNVHSSDGVAALVETFSPPAAAALRRNESRLLPVKLLGSLANDARAAREAGMPAGAGFKIDGNAGGFAFDLRGVAEAASDSSLLATFTHLGSAKVVVGGRVDAGDGRTLMETIGLDPLVSVDGGPGWLDFKVSGRLDGAMEATAQVAAGGFDASISGTLQAPQSQAATANLILSIAQAKVRVPQTGTLPAKLTARLSYADGAIALNQMTGTVARSDIVGRLAIGLSPTMSLDGDIRLGAVDLQAVIAAAVGTPEKRAGGNFAWPADPFAGGILGQFRGRIAMASARTALTSSLVAENLHGVLNFGPSGITLDGFEADIAGGRVSGRLAFERDGDEVSVRNRVRLSKADIAALFSGDRPPMSGKLSMDAEIEGRGRSPVALIGSLQGKGSFSIEDGRLAQLDPSAFDTVIRSVDQGMPIEATRIKERVEAALARGALSIQGDGSITAAAGKASLTGATLRAEGADIAISARYDLVAEALDAKLVLVGPTGVGDVDIGRPEIAISLHGSIESSRRTLDVAALSSWLSSRAIAQNARRVAAISALDAHPIEATQASPAAKPPALPANPVPPPDGVKTDASALPPNLAKPEPAAGAAAAGKPEAPANTPSAAKPAADTFAATKPVPPNGPPPPAARDSAVVEIPGEANLAPAEPGIAELDRAIAVNPNDGAALAKRGQFFAMRRNYGSAIKDFDEVIRLRPRDAEAFNNRCWARAIIGDLESALSDCNAALQLRPRYADAFDSRGMINLKFGQPGKAIADYDAALRINPKLASSLYGRGIAKIKNDNPASGSLDIVEAKAIQANIAEEFAGYGIR
jgi:AsmA family/AsmA-like C-terminal region